MTIVCRNGHESSWPDWCSTCGERIGAPGSAATTSTPPAAAGQAAAGGGGVPSPVAAPPAGPGSTSASTSTCGNCGADRGEHDMFCENCGYDFASGSLPEATPGAHTMAMGLLAPFHVKVSIDPEFFAASVGDVELALPDPLPQLVVIPLAGSRILIGRQSISRAIFPEIDLPALTGDPAVSSRHAMLERSPDGAWTLTDLGSTNGTFMTADASSAITPGQALPVAAGATIFMGAWSRIDLAETTAG